MNEEISFVSLPPTVRKLVRQCENVEIKIVKNRSAIVFNENCVNNDLLPIYTNSNVTIVDDN